MGFQSDARVHARVNLSESISENPFLSGDAGINKGFYFLMHDLGRERLMLAMAGCIQLGM